MRRINRKKDRGNISTKTGGRRMRRSSGGGKIEQPVEGKEPSPENLDAKRPGYGYTENQKRDQKYAGRGESDIESSKGSLEDEDQGLDQSKDIPEQARRKTEESGEGRPDQLSSGEEDEEVVSTEGENITERLDADRERSTGDRDLDPNSMNAEEPLEIDESDSEARGGMVDPENPEGEEFRKKGRGGRHGNRTNNPE